jgi:hypothetical protein
MWIRILPLNKMCEEAEMILIFLKRFITQFLSCGTVACKFLSPYLLHFLYECVLYDFIWIAIFLHVLWLWTFALSSKDWQYCLIKQVTSNIYNEDRVKMFSFFNSCLQDVLEFTPAINLITLFWSIKIFLFHPLLPP